MYIHNNTDRNTSPVSGSRNSISETFDFRLAIPEQAIRHESNFIRRFVKARHVAPAAERLQSQNLPGFQFDVGYGRVTRIKNSFEVHDPLDVFAFQPGRARVLAQIEIRPFGFQPIRQHRGKPEPAVARLSKTRRILK